MVYKKNNYLLKKYGITEEDYTVMLIRQGYKCAICGIVPSGRSLHVDHNHKTKKVRGLLCWKCNHAIGTRGFSDNAKSCLNAHNYLLIHDGA